MRQPPFIGRRNILRIQLFEFAADAQEVLLRYRRTPL
jgi:hypothetical protein